MFSLISEEILRHLCRELLIICVTMRANSPCCIISAIAPDKALFQPKSIDIFLISQ